MTCEELVKLKAGLLCLGVRVDEQAAKKLVSERPYFYDKGFVHAVNINISGTNICISVAEKFCKASPYLLTEREGKYLIRYEGGEAEIKLFKDLPQTGTVIDEIARPHSDECISLWPSLDCCYDKPNLKCKFCSLEKVQSVPIVPSSEVVEGLKRLFEQTDSYGLNVGGGTVKNPDEMIGYLLEIVKGVRAFSENELSLEIAPPENLDLINALKAAGASSLILNLEIARDELRKQICPGKGRIAYEHYYAAYKRGVEVFGRGKISCVLIVGIQDNADIMAECDKLTDVGVIPTLIPFKPMDDCELSDHAPAKPEDLLIVSAHLGKLLSAKGLSPRRQGGCTKCGGCSLETNYAAV